MEIGINSFASLLPERNNGRIPNPAERLAALLEEITLADEAGIDVFGVGEHHRTDFADSSPAVILAAAAARTKKIRLTSAVSVLSTVDPVRLFQDFSTLDLLSQGRAEITVGRGSFAEAYSLFGHSRDDYDALFTEKLGLLQQLVRETHMVRPLPSSAYGPGRLSPANAESAAGLGRCWRDTALLHPGRSCGSAADGGAYRGQTRSFPAINRPLPAGRYSCRLPSRAA